MFAHLESRFSEFKADMQPHTAETKAQLAEAKNSITLWSVTAIFLAQLLPALLKLFLPS